MGAGREGRKDGWKGRRKEGEVEERREVGRKEGRRSVLAKDKGERNNTSIR